MGAIVPTGALGTKSGTVLIAKGVRKVLENVGQNFRDGRLRRKTLYHIKRHTRTL